MRDYRKFISIVIAIISGFYVTVIEAALRRTDNPGLSSKGMSSAKPVVVIYYANETVAEGSADSKTAKNRETLIEWLRSHPSYEEFAGYISDDVKSFSKQVSQEARDIQSGLENSRAPVRVVVFTNALALNNLYLMYSANQRAVKAQSISFTFEKSPSAILQDSPLTLRANLENALSEVIRQFPPSQYRLLPIFKSHGDQNLLFRPKVLIDTTRLTENTFKKIMDDASLRAFTLKLKTRTYDHYFLKNLLGFRSQYSANVKLPLSKFVNVLGSPDSMGDSLPALGVNVLGSADAMGDSLHFLGDRAKLGDSTSLNQLYKLLGYEVTQEHFGLSKILVAHILDDLANKNSFTWPVLVAESCESRFNKPPKKVMTVFSSPTELDYKNLDYRLLIETLGQDKGLAESVETALLH